MICGVHGCPEYSVTFPTASYCEPAGAALPDGFELGSAHPAKTIIATMPIALCQAFIFPPSNSIQPIESARNLASIRIPHQHSSQPTDITSTASDSSACHETLYHTIQSFILRLT